LHLIRSFLSLNIESSLQNRLKKIQDDAKSELAHYGIKWENSNKFHLTLRFLGDVEEKQLGEISKELAGINTGFDIIKLTASGIGFFPDQKYPNVVYIDLMEEGNNSEALVDKLDSVLLKYNFKPDKKFIPHVTIGRFRREKKKRLDKSISVEVEPLEIIFNSFNMMKSTLKPSGSVYELIQEFKFNNRIPILS